MTTGSAMRKAQSAMEYLMTYGWAILLIAVVLSVLFYLGLFNGSSLLGNTCLAAPGFFCQSAIYSHSTANIIVNVGQNTGTNWATANFVFVPQGTPLNSGVPNISFTGSPANTVLFNGGLQSGIQQQLYLPVNSIVPPVNVGTQEMGAIWVQYTYNIASGGVVRTFTGYANMAEINIKAT